MVAGPPKDDVRISLESVSFVDPSEWLVTRDSGRAYDLVYHARTCLILAARLSQRASVPCGQQVPDTESRAQTLTESNTAAARVQQCRNFKLQ